MIALSRFTLVIITSILLVSFHFQEKHYLITNYGAVADTFTINTAAIQKAIDKCAADGGGTVVIPKGVFVSGSIFLREKVNLHIAEGGVLKGSMNEADYPQIDSRWEGEEKKWTACLVNAIHLKNIKVTGPGTIDGSGVEWTAKPRGSLHQGKPRLIGFQNSNKVKISNLKLRNQASWGLFVLYSTNVEINGLHITAAHNIPSSDGIDIDSGKDIEIRNCYIDVNDDCISIKSGKDEDGLRVNRPSENITIEKCTFGYGHGGVAMGSETSGGIRNVLIKDCVAGKGNWAPIRFKSQPSRGGVVENITYQNFRLDSTRKAVEFNMAWRMVPPIKPPAKVLPVVKNVRLINITGNVNTIGDIHGLEGSPIQGIKFKNCNLTAQKGLLIEHARNVDLAGLKMTVKEGEPITRKDVETGVDF
jgi:polygalacturonase